MTSRRTLRRVTSVLVVACASAAPAIAGVRRDDRADSLHTALGNDPRYASVGSIIYGLNRGSGTLITPRWVLTAGHVVDSTTSRTFRYGGTAYNNGTAVTASQHFAHPSWTRMDITGGFDIGLVRLPTPITTITPASRFTGAELGMVGTSVGFGLSGTGSSGHNIFDTAGLKRAGTNTLDALGSAFVPAANDRIIGADFDDPANADGRNVFGSAT